MDLTNQYGTQILSPLDWERYSLDLSFIIDPYVTIGLLLCVILGWRIKKRAPLIAAVTLVLLLSYFGIRHYLHNEAEDFLRARLDANTYKMCPLPNDFLRWWFVARSGNEYVTGFADLFTRRVCIQERYANNLENPYVIRSKEDRGVENFLHFAKYPYAEVRKENGNVVVIWRELAFSFRAGEHFVTKVVFDKSGKIIGSKFRF